MPNHVVLWEQTAVDKICLICQGREERKVILKSKEQEKTRPKVTSARQQAENQDKTFSAHAQLLLHLFLNNFYVHIMSQSRQQCHLSQGSKFKFEFGSTCATRCKLLGALPKF